MSDGLFDGSKHFADRIDGLKRDLLARPELGELTKNIWSNMQSFIERSAAGETHVLQHANTIIAIATQELSDTEVHG